MKVHLEKEKKEIPSEKKEMKEKKEKPKKKNVKVAHKRVGKTACKWLRAYVIEMSRRNLWLQWILETDFSGPVDLDRAP